MKFRYIMPILLCCITFLGACQFDTRMFSATKPPAISQPMLTFQQVGQTVNRPGLVFALPDTRTAVIAQGGIITVLTDGTPWLDIRDRIADTAPERGLLGAAVSPDTNVIFVSYSRRSDAATTLARIPLVDGNPNVAALQEIYAVPQPYANHNGGHIAFGPDGYLYMGLGDGGSGGDPDKVARNPQSPLGKIVRLDVSDASVPYTIPTGQPVRPDWLPEVVAQGLRNPWRFGFGADGDFWVADVGQGRYEELNVVPLTQLLGSDFGWSEREGTHCFDAQQQCQIDGLVDPVAEYDHSAGQCSITGGAYVPALYQGLGGAIMYADYCAGTVYIWDPLNGARLLIDTDYQISSFGSDADGYLYVSDYRSGNVYKIIMQSQ